MEFSNALSGVKILRAAAILSFCALILTSVLTLIGLIAPNSSLAVLTFMALLVFCASVAVFVIRLVGVSRAARDQSKFSDARTVIIIGIVLSLLGGLLFQGNGVPDALAELLVSACGLWATVLIIKGILAFAELFRIEDMRLEGNRLIRVVLVSEGFTMAVNLLKALLPASTGVSLILLILTFLSLALQIWQLILFLRYLRNAIEMLTVGNPAIGIPGSVSLPHSIPSQDRDPEF